jgi:hypothetical protein
LRSCDPKPALNQRSGSGLGSNPRKRNVKRFLKKPARSSLRRRETAPSSSFLVEFCQIVLTGRRQPGAEVVGSVGFGRGPYYRVDESRRASRFEALLDAASGKLWNISTGDSYLSVHGRSCRSTSLQAQLAGSPDSPAGPKSMVVDVFGAEEKQRLTNCTLRTPHFGSTSASSYA